MYINEYDDAEKSSILDKSVSSLLVMDCDEVKKVFIDEIKALENLDDKKRDIRLKKIFNNLIKLIPWYGDFGGNHEMRLFVDLISIDGLFEIDYVKKVVDNLDLSDSQLLFISKLSKFYSSHSKEEIEKFNYVFKSGCFIDILWIKDRSLIDLFDSYVLNLFDKESLSQICREYLSHPNKAISLFSLFSEDKRKQLFMMAALSKKIKLLTGHDQEFIDAFMSKLYFGHNIMGVNRFIGCFYDEYVGGREHEEEFIKKIQEEDNLEINSLVNWILDGKKSKIYFRVNDFKNDVKERQLKYHSYIFNDINNMNSNNFKNINSDDDLNKFKEAILYNFYGISLEKSLEIVKRYGSFIDELEREVIDDDRDILSVLKAIKNIVDLEVDDDLKINTLQLMYYDKMRDNNFLYMDKYYSWLVLQSLFNKMFFDIYLLDLLDISRDELKLIDKDNDVLIYDSSNSFRIMLTSLAGVTDFYDGNVNMASKWNTSFRSNNHGLCCSYIDNSNLGVISLDSVLFGFCDISVWSLNKMGISDIFSNTGAYNLKFSNDLGEISSIFYPRGKCFSEGRYGYNEFLIDRYLMEDKDSVLKLQPNYIVCYKFNENYKNSNLYKRSLKVAKDFKIPIVIIDVVKVKEQERREISLMEKDLFSRNECNKSLMSDIVNRYMCNFTGSFVMTEDRGTYYNEDFSVEGMRVFFDNLFMKINTLTDISLRNDWIKALEEVYYDEERKFKNAKRISSFSSSVQEFGLNKYDLLNKIECLKNSVSYVENKRKIGTVCFTQDGNLITKAAAISNEEEMCYDELITDIDYYKYSLKVLPNDKSLCNFLLDEDYSPGIEVITSLVNELGYNNTKFEVYKNYDFIDGLNGVVIWSSSSNRNDKILIENLIVSYFFESQSMLVDDLVCHDYDCDISFSCSDDFDFVSMISNSYSYRAFWQDNSVEVDDLMLVVGVVYLMDNEKFLKLFSPVIMDYCSKTGKRFEDISCDLLDKKKNIKEAFESLSKNLEENKLNIKK